MSRHDGKAERLRLRSCTHLHFPNESELNRLRGTPINSAISRYMMLAELNSGSRNLCFRRSLYLVRDPFVGAFEPFL